MKLKHFSILFTITGIFLLYFLSTLTQPQLIEIKEISKYDGKTIIAQGTVIEYHYTKQGSQSIIIENNNFTSIVFVEEKTDVEYGDRIQVTGEVQKYDNKYEIVVNNKNFVKILEKWTNISYPLWQLAQNPSKYNGLNVNVTGYIDNCFDSYFYLSGQTKKCSLIVFFNPNNNVTVSPGKMVYVSCIFSFDDKNFRYILEADEGPEGIIFLE